MERGTRTKDHMTGSYALSLAAVLRAQAGAVETGMCAPLPALLGGGYVCRAAADQPCWTVPTAAAQPHLLRAHARPAHLSTACIVLANPHPGR